MHHLSNTNERESAATELLSLQNFSNWSKFHMIIPVSWSLCINWRDSGMKPITVCQLSGAANLIVFEQAPSFFGLR